MLRSLWEGVRGAYSSVERWWNSVSPLAQLPIAMGVATVISMGVMGAVGAAPVAAAALAALVSVAIYAVLALALETIWRSLRLGSTSAGVASMLSTIARTTTALSGPLATAAVLFMGSPSTESSRPLPVVDEAVVALQTPAGRTEPGSRVQTAITFRIDDPQGFRQAAEERAAAQRAAQAAQAAPLPASSVGILGAFDRREK